MSEETKDGTTTIAIKNENGMVVLNFPRPVKWCELDPMTASQVAEEMARHAYRAKHGGEPKDKRSLISAQVRDKLVTRVRLVSKTLAERGKDPNYVASSIVDIVLSEVAGE